MYYLKPVIRLVVHKLVCYFIYDDSCRHALFLLNAKVSKGYDVIERFTSIVYVLYVAYSNMLAKNCANKTKTMNRERVYTY